MSLEEIEKAIVGYDNDFSKLIILRDLLAANRVVEADKDMLLQKIFWLNSFFGNYETKSWNLNLARNHNVEKSLLPAEEKRILSSYQAQDAVKELNAIAQNHQVIFINEAHHTPAHRVFTRQVLRILAEKGYRYFFAETLNNWDNDLMQRGFPEINKTGFYTDEPFFGDLIREAIKLNFKILPYESEDCSTQNRREEGQARNIFEGALKNDPTAKIVVLAGYAHIYEKELAPGYVPMAVHFKKITGIDPFTIDQTIMCEFSDYEPTGHFRFITNKFKQKRPFFLKNEDNKFWNGKNCLCDALLITPPATQINGWPEWAMENGERVFYRLNLKDYNMASPFIVKAVKAEETEKAVPVCQIEVKNPHETRYLLLPRGDYTLIFVDKNGKKRHQESIKAL